MPKNRQLILAARPKPGLFSADCFQIEESDVEPPDDGEFLVRNRFVSLDPAMRGWVNAGKSYVPPVAIGDVMRSFSAGVVEASNHPDFKPGDTVQGLLGVQHYAITDGTRINKVDTQIAPLERWVGGLGMPGWTAYFGLNEILQPKAGETIVVSAASGAVGSIVGQLAKIKGCRVVGIAGGPEKCAYLVDELGFDAAVDYKADGLAAALAEAAPDGFDMNFENVGGEIFDTILLQMNTFGRIALCGAISAYSASGPVQGPQNLRAILTQRLKMQGLIVFDWAKRIDEAIHDLGQWHSKGQLKIREDVRDGGLERFVDVVNLLYTSGNQGKLVLRLG